MRSTEDLERRLVDLGRALAVDDVDLVDVVTERIGTPTPTPRPRRLGWVVVAAIVLLVVSGVVLYPDTRHAVARWLGLDGVDVQVDHELPIAPPPVSFDPTGPGRSQVVEVDGRQILVSSLDGAWNDTLVTKTVGDSDQVERVQVDGQPGLWISGAPHEVLYESPTGEIVVERVAANTLLWQRDGVLWRVEGFTRLSEALDFVEGT